MYLMASSFVKIVFADSQRSCLFFSGRRECAYSTAHTISCEKRVYDIHWSVFFLRKNYFTTG